MEELKRSRANLDEAARCIEAFLVALGIDRDTHPELANTGSLVAQAFDSDLLDGYGMDPSRLLSETMPAGGAGPVVVHGMTASIVCPHHLLPATGVVHVGYVPDANVVGLGALARLVQCFARRLTLQETFVQCVAAALVEHLGALSAVCVADMSPSCLTARGERKSAARVMTVGTAGSADPDTLLQLVRSASDREGPT